MQRIKSYSIFTSRQTDTHTQTHTDRHTQTDAHRQTHTPRRTQTDAHRQTHTDRRTQTDAHRQTHTDRCTFCIPICMGKIYFYMEIYTFHYTMFLLALCSLTSFVKDKLITKLQYLKKSGLV